MHTVNTDQQTEQQASHFYSKLTPYEQVECNTLIQALGIGSEKTNGFTYGVSNEPWVIVSGLRANINNSRIIRAAHEQLEFSNPFNMRIVGVTKDDVSIVDGPLDSRMAGKALSRDGNNFFAAFVGRNGDIFNECVWRDAPEQGCVKTNRGSKKTNMVTHPGYDLYYDRRFDGARAEKVMELLDMSLKYLKENGTVVLRSTESVSEELISSLVNRYEEQQNRVAHSFPGTLGQSERHGFTLVNTVEGEIGQGKTGQMLVLKKTRYSSNGYDYSNGFGDLSQPQEF